MHTFERGQRGELVYITLTPGVKHAEGWLPKTP